MRIAVISSTFPPYHGGMGRVAVCDAGLLSGLGHEVHVFTSQRGAVKEAEGQPYAVHELKAWLRWGHGAFAPGTAWIPGNFDLTILHYPFFGGAEPLWFGRLLGVRGKLLVYYHMDVTSRGPFYPFLLFNRRFALRKLVGSADRVLVSTMDYAEHGDLARVVETRRGLFGELFLTVDTERFSPKETRDGLAAELGCKPEDKVVLFVAGLDKAHYFKGLGNLLLAMTAPELEKAKLVVVGGGDLREEYERQAEVLGLRGRAVFAGFVDDADLPDYYRLADVMAFPSIDKSEAFGIAALEAMSSGLPVVASNLAGVRTIVREGETGLRVPAGSSSALTLALDRVLSDGEFRREMGRNARDMVVREYSDAARQKGWDAIVKDMFPDWRHFSS